MFYFSLQRFFFLNILLSAQYLAMFAGDVRRKECKDSCIICCVVVDFNQNSSAPKRYGVTLRCLSLDNDQLDAHLLYFTIRPLQPSTCYEHYMF